MSHPVWTARCKSGYEFNRRPCRRMCSRGELLCAECATAEVIPAEKIIAGRNVIEYIRLRRQGFVAAWSGNGQICMVKREAA